MWKRCGNEIGNGHRFTFDVCHSTQLHCTVEYISSLVCNLNSVYCIGIVTIFCLNKPHILVLKFTSTLHHNQNVKQLDIVSVGV